MITLAFASFLVLVVAWLVVPSSDVAVIEPRRHLRRVPAVGPATP